MMIEYLAAIRHDMRLWTAYDDLSIRQSLLQLCCHPVSRFLVGVIHAESDHVRISLDDLVHVFHQDRLHMVSQLGVISLSYPHPFLARIPRIEWHGVLEPVPSLDVDVEHRSTESCSSAHSTEPGYVIWREEYPPFWYHYQH